VDPTFKLCRWASSTTAAICIGTVVKSPQVRIGDRDQVDPGVCPVCGVSGELVARIAQDAPPSFGFPKAGLRIGIKEPPYAERPARATTIRGLRGAPSTASRNRYNR